MKTAIQQLSLSLMTALLLAGCGGGEDGTPLGDDEKGTRELQQNASLKGVINPVADVDWYSITMTGPGIVSLNLYNETLRYDVDVLATVYAEDQNGELQRLAADHFAENNTSKASLSINVNVTHAQKILVAVRDLDDNDASTTESYSISYDIAAPEDNNGSFESAAELPLNGSCHTDSIGTVGDIDVMRFNVPTSGVYELATDYSAFAGGTSVALKVSLFDSEGTLVRTVTQTEDSVYRLVESLAAGNYYLLVHDQGKDNFDTASPYTTCLTQVTTAEVSADDTQAAAKVINGNGHYVINGSLDYAGDQDWSSVQSGATPPSIQVLQIEFDPSDSNGCNSWYLMEVTDSNGVVLFSKEYSTETGSRTAHVKVQSSGEHFVSVSAVDDHVCSLEGKVGMPYQITVDAVNVSDDAEMGAGNNTINNAIEIDETANTATEAMLSYVGDVDWYHIVVPADHNQDRVLEVFIDSENATPLEYYVTVFAGDKILDTFTARNNEEYPISFKSSYFIPSNAGNTNADYFVKVVDMQSDEADINGTYTVRSNILPVQTQAPAVADSHVANAAYRSETEEQTALLTDNNVIELVVDATDHRKYSFNATGFAIADGQAASLVSSDTAANTLTVTFPWQAGYVDYYKDRDWYQLNLPAIYAAAGGTADTWYSEIRVELYTPAPGSQVEYAWGLYRDRSNNQVVNDWQGNDGFFATNGDTSATVEALNLITPAADATSPMWVSNTTAEDIFYLTVTDIINQSTHLADNDWGYDQPYFVRVQLVFYSNLSQPN